MSLRAQLIQMLIKALRPIDARILRGLDLWRPITQLGRQPEPGHTSTEGLPGPFFKVFAGKAIVSYQVPFDFAVVMPSTLRPTIAAAIRSVFAQDIPGRVQLLVGVDRPSGADVQLLDEVCRDIPDRHAVYLLYPGYSTSRRHGGLHHAWDGGVLRTVLTYLANSRYVAYLDDDNWWDPAHLRSLHDAIQDHDWAYAHRWFVHPISRRPVCIDQWESIGPGRGLYAKNFGGWVDPNCIAIDKIACEAVIRWWTLPLRNTSKAMDADRNVFRILSTEFKGRATGSATVFYVIDEQDRQHPYRLEKMGADRYAACRAAE